MNQVEEEENKYEIEEIIDRREVDGTTEYLIKWKDLDSTQNTWEPLDNLLLDRVFESIFTFEKSPKALEKPPNDDVKDFLKYFKDFDLSSNENKLTEMPFGSFLTDEAEKILYIDENENEKYAYIKWKTRPNGKDPISTLVNTRVVAVFVPQLYLDYLEDVVELQK